MSLFPQSFIDELKSHGDIVQIVQERGVVLKRSGSSWKGLCPFHGEKTPSFHVYDKGLFKCYGCSVGGDVIKFVELYDKITFPEAVRQLAARVGMAVPEGEGAKQDAEDQRERETLLKAHEVAAGWFRQQLAAPAGAAARRQLAERGLTAETVERMGIGYGPPAREALKAHLLKAGFSLAALVRAGLLVQRDEGAPIDRFRNRLMIPIHRDNGAIIGFGGRAMDAGQVPKYLNSPETPIYTKGRTLYGLHLSKTAIARSRLAVMVEGYFDVGQCLQAGITNVVASSGTALTPVQARLLKRFAATVVLSFDPDAAGQGAAARSSELLVSEGFRVSVAMLPPGDDPDNFIRKHGGAAYQERLRNSQPYLDYLLERAAAGYDFRKDDDRGAFLREMLTVAARIPDAPGRDQFADRLAHRARITEEVVRAEIRKAAVAKQTTVEARAVPVASQVKAAEKGLIWAVMRTPSEGLNALADLVPEDMEGLATAGILQQARTLQGWPAETLPGTLLERLSKGEAALVQAIAAQPQPPARVLSDCVVELRRHRLLRERAAIDRQMEKLLEEGIESSDHRIDELGARKIGLKQQLEAL